MTPEPDFYIGWQDKAPASYAWAVRRVIWGLALLVPTVAGLLVWQQRGFSDAVFGYGHLTTLKGELIQAPLPFLRVPIKNAAANKPRFERILLIGLGKHGADATIHQWEQRYGALTGKNLNIRGTRIDYEGYAALELTEQADALLEVSQAKTSLSKPVAPLGHVTVQGEITDPKCFLGVMKPGDGRPHRSCAVRCIAGGIPPLLWVWDGKKNARGYLLVGPSGEPLNSQILSTVGHGVRVSGRLEQADNWQILYVDAPVEITRFSPDTQGAIALCK